MPSTDAEGGPGVHEPSEPPAKTAEGKSSASLLKGASGAGVTTFAVTLLIILRVFALAQWRWDTAGAIMATVNLGGIPSVVVSSIHAEPLISAFIVAAGAPVVLAFTLHDLRGRRRFLVGGTLFTLLLGAAGISLLVTYRWWWILPVAVAVYIASISLLRPGAPDGARRAGRLIVPGAIAVCVALQLFVAAFSSTPWIEREAISVSSGETIEGYVLEVKSGFVKILDEERDVRIVLSGDIASREIL
ncbi:hypothetical protein FM106_17085 [Brachybacterium faecium]|nr:hypothetical protein FM106_17085 [Brachybacterium faecium]